MRRQGPHLLLELLGYLLVALVGVRPALKPGLVVGDGVDLYGTIWFYWWIQDCVAQLNSPGFTELFFFPLGKDIFAHTGNNFVDALAAVPFVSLLGVPDFEPWFVVALLMGNALTFRVLAKDLFTNRWAVFAATLAWTLNPYVLFEITCGRLTQAFLPFLPLAFHHLLRLERELRWRDAALMGLYTALQAWTYWFMGWFMAFAFAWLVAWGLIRSSERRALLGRVAFAGGVCLLLVSPAALTMAGAAAQGQVPGLDGGTGGIFELPQQLGNNVAATLHGYLLMEEEGAPMLGHLSWGIPALLWVLLGPGRARWLPVGLGLLVMSIGPVWPTEQGPVALPHYMAAYHLLPFFNRLWFPYRMLVVVMLVASLGMGFLMARLLAWRPGLWPAAPVLLVGWAGLTGWEQHQYSVYPFVTRDLTPPQTFQLVADNPGAVLHLPFGITQPAIVWQTHHGQPLFGGMGENAPLLWPDGFKNRLRNSFVKALVDTARDPDEARPFNPGQQQRFKDEGFRWVVLHRDLVESDIHHWAYGRTLDEQGREQAGLEVTRALMEVLGPPTSAEGTYVAWDLQGTARVPEGLMPTEQALFTRSWGQQSLTDYERALEERGRLPGGPGPQAPR